MKQQQDSPKLRHVASYASGTGQLLWEGYLEEGSEAFEAFRRVEDIDSFMVKLTRESAGKSA